MIDFTKLRIAVLATDGFEESELLEPVRALRDAGAQVDILAPPPVEGSRPAVAGTPSPTLPNDERTQMIQGFRHFDKGIKVPVSRYLDEPDALPEQYDALVLPGGALNADKLRTEKLAIRFVQEMQATEKPIAAICHAAWTLISARLTRGRTMTSYPSIQDDLRNAGANWVDSELVVDGNWITSRKPDDLQMFSDAIIDQLEGGESDVRAAGKGTETAHP
jgi:protease I